jgi:hypothetical protein
MTTTMNPQGQRCENCRFFVEGEVYDEIDGACRFNPPVIVFAPDLPSRFPQVLPWDWCGKWEPMTEDQRAAKRAAERKQP